jgi:hypothetical protein
VHKIKKELMKNNTKVRLRLSKQLFESLSKQIIAEAKANDGYTVAVKQPKMPKQSKSQAASPEVQKTDKEATMDEMSSKEKMAKGLYKETEKESAKKVMADITALSKEDQAKVKKFISSRSKKQSLKEYEHHYEVRNGQCRRYNDEGEYTVVAMHYCR